jgi:uncharacterized membrane protein YfcA
VVIFEALVIGVVVGAVLGLVGAGGAILAVPAFVYVFGMGTLQATTASLAVVTVAASSGVIPRFRQHQVRVKQALVFWVIGLAGTFAGSVVAPRIPETILLGGFAVIMLGAAVAMWRKSAGPVTEGGPKVSVWLLIVVALGIGLLTGIFGVGGGFLIVPALVLIFGFPFPAAAGTSLLVIALNSVSALAFKASTWSEISWHIPLIVIIGALIGSLTSSALNMNISQRILERSFAILLVILAAWMITEPLIFEN